MNEQGNATAPPEPRWWVSVGGPTEGPYVASYILASLKSGTLLADSTLACLEGTEQWKALSEWPQFNQGVHTEPAQRPVPDASVQAEESVSINTSETSSTPTDSAAERPPLTDRRNSLKPSPGIPGAVGWGIFFW